MELNSNLGEMGGFWSGEILGFGKDRKSVV